MSASEIQRLGFRDKFRCLHNTEFQTWFEQLAAALHPRGDFQAIRNTRGDGGIDGFVINSQLVYQVYAPARGRDLRDAETAKKITEDFPTVVATLGGRMREWCFVHNHPEAKIGQKTAAAISELKARHPSITLSVLNIDTLWEKLTSLPDEVLTRLFPVGKTAVQSTAIDPEVARSRLAAINSTFAVPALEIRLPINKVWDRLRWEGDPDGTSTERSPSLEEVVRRHYEWARLGRGDDHSRDFPAATLLKPGSRSVILGGPGAGKSTLARKLAWQATSSGRSVWHVSLRAVARLMERNSSFVEALHISTAQQAGTADQCWPAGFRPDVLIADGLDEAEPNRLPVAEALRAWSANNGVCVIATTRPVGHSPGILPEFRTAELLPLSDRATNELALLLLGAVNAPAEQTKEFIELMSASRRSRPSSSASMLARRNPLLLSFLVALHRDGQPVTGNRATLYSRILELIEHAPVNDRFVNNPVSAGTFQMAERHRW